MKINDLKEHHDHFEMTMKIFVNGLKAREGDDDVDGAGVLLLASFIHGI